MAQGTGLPLPKPGNDLASAPSINADALSSAAAWTRIAASGAQLANTGLDLLARDEHLRQAGAVADFENEWRQKNVEARDQFAHDPDGFKNWSQASIDGAVGQVPAWMAGHAKTFLERTFNGSYSTILSERRTRDENLAGKALEARRKSADDDVMALASGGKVGTDEWNAAVAVHNSVLQTAVETGRIPEEQADYLRNDLAGRAEGEVAARDAVKIYREQGFDAAVEHLTKSVRDNDALSIKTSQRYAAFNRGMSQLRLEQGRDKEDRGAAVEVSKDLRARITNNENIDPAEVKTTSDELARTGAWTERRNLVVSAGIHDAIAPYRPGGGKTIPQLGADVARMRGEAAPELQTAIQSASFRRGVPADYLTRTAIREGTGRNPTSTAEGYFQFTNQTWLATFKDNAGGLGLGELASKIEQGPDGRLTVADPAARARILGLRNDAQVAADMAGALTAANAQTLKAGLGRDPSQVELYAAHFLGPAGALSMLKADKSAIAAEINPAAAGANASIFYTKDGRPKTVGEVIANLTNASTQSADPASLGAITKGVQQFYVAQEKKVWPQMKAMLEKGENTDPMEFEGLRYAAQISGDTEWANEVEAFAAARGYGQILKQASLGEGQAVMDKARAYRGGENATVNDRKVLELVEKQYDRQVRMATDDPIGLALESDPTLKPPPPLDFSSPDTAKAGLNARIALARRTATAKDTPLGSPLRPAERAATAAAITSGAPAQAASAFSMLASTPDDALLPTLGSKEIKETVAGAIRSSDPARYQGAMSFLDGVWQRAPESVDNLFGADAVHDLVAWQTTRRYLSPDDQAKQRSQAALDPQVKERQKAAFAEGLTMARKLTPQEVVSKFDQSWWVTPGFVARNVTGTEPIGPSDPVARAALLGDWSNNVARVYANALDKDSAIKKGTEITRTKWTASPLNGGRLMLNAPEKYYPAVGGSWDWMSAQLTGDLAKTLGPRTPEFSVIPSVPNPFNSGVPKPNWDWELVSDRQTESEAQRGQPPSYLVRVDDHRTGTSRIMPRRYRWQTDAGPGNPTAAFQQQRARVLEAEHMPPLFPNIPQPRQPM